MPRAAAILTLVLIASSPSYAATILHLSDTEVVMAHPDLLVALLQAVGSGASASAAQQQVNAAVSAALTRARDVAGITVSTQQYTTWQPKEQGRWQASHTIMVSSHDGPALLTLAGQLQASGLAVTELDWQLSPDASRKARDEAMREAIAHLRARADDAAGLLGLRFELFQRVSIASPEAMPVPRMAAMAMAAAPPTPPSAVAQDVPVSSTAEADAVLVPK